MSQAYVLSEKHRWSPKFDMYYYSSPLLGPVFTYLPSTAWIHHSSLFQALDPILEGVLTSGFIWCAIFWFLTILSGFSFSPSLFSSATHFGVSEALHIKIRLNDDAEQPFETSNNLFVVINFRPMLRRARRNQARALLLQTTLVDVTCPSPMWQQLELDPLFPKRTFSLSFKLEKPRLFIHFPVSIAFENRLLAYCCDLITCTLSICRPWNDIYSVVSSEHFSLPNLKFIWFEGTVMDLTSYVVKYGLHRCDISIVRAYFLVRTKNPACLISSRSSLAAPWKRSWSIITTSLQTMH